jgi:hypothetical protein
MTQSPYVKSQFARVPDDYYPTIDPRCVKALVKDIPGIWDVVDVCAPMGSGIVDEFLSHGITAGRIGDAFQTDVKARWIVTNPPYVRPLVDKIIARQIERIEAGEVFGLAVLVRSTFDHARSRTRLFRDNRYYAGQVKLLFRPWWNVEHTASPIHNYVWQVWKFSSSLSYPKDPFIHYEGE